MRCIVEAEDTHENQNLNQIQGKKIMLSFKNCVYKFPTPWKGWFMIKLNTIGHIQIYSGKLL